MQLTNKQEQGLRIAVQRYIDREPYTCISGFAGTGKSTLIQFIIAALEIDPMDVVYIAYTGKAAQVLKSKGCPNVMTAHKLLYKSVPQRDGTFKHFPKTFIGDYKLIVVDEISMLPDRMWQLLLSHHIPVIACGDPFQLEPLGGDNHVLDRPHIFLDEIMRQAAESEIIRLSMDIRERKRPQVYRGSEINVVAKKNFSDGMLGWADQTICGKNATRNELNSYYRSMKWEGRDISVPIPGDRVICLKNNWDEVTGSGEALVNGTIGVIDNIKCSPHLLLGQMCIIDFIPDFMSQDAFADDIFSGLLIDWNLITAHKATITQENYSKFPKSLRPEQFDYGYVITCHKSQGSEYDKVLVIEEILKSTDHARWLYTACTRASKKLTLVLKD